VLKISSILEKIVKVEVYAEEKKGEQLLKVILWKKSPPIYWSSEAA